MDSAAPLFAGWKKTMVRSCLQGHMGTVVTDGRTPPESALCAVGDFCFLAGRPDPELARQADRPILIPRTPDWEPVIRSVFGEKASPFPRYAMDGPEAFDRERLAAYAAALPEGYALSPILPQHYPVLMGQAWSKDLCGNFRDGDDFVRRGLGVIVLLEGVPVAGASSYTICDGIDTRPDQRRKGLALSCGARLILDCLDRGLVPSWDAHNLPSVALAEKLGYRLHAPYRAYLLDLNPS